MIITFIGIGLALLFLGYFSGRAGHVFFGHWKAPHHWIYGLLFILIGLISDFDKMPLTLAFISFGAGCFISDISDFFRLKFISPDTNPERKFFGFD